MLLLLELHFRFAEHLSQFSVYWSGNAIFRLMNWSARFRVAVHRFTDRLPFSTSIKSNSTVYTKYAFRSSPTEI